MYRRDLEYGIIFKIFLIERVVSFLVIVVLVFILENYWVMIIGVLVVYISKILFFYWYVFYFLKFLLSCIKE